MDRSIDGERKESIGPSRFFTRRTKRLCRRLVGRSLNEPYLPLEGKEGVGSFLVYF